MSLTRILVLASGGRGDDRALTFGAEIASQHEGRCNAVPVYPDSAADMVSLGIALGASISRDAVEDLAAAEREAQGHIEESARRAASAADVVFGDGDGAPRLSVLARDLRPASAVSRQAALADLGIVAQEAVSDRPVRDLFAQLLLVDRTPVLMASGEPDRLSAAAAIAWDGSPQAGRAVRASLPVLAMAAQLHVVQCLTGLSREAGDPDIEALNAYLTLHGVGRGDPVLIECGEEGPALLGTAEAMGASLLVAGAWGHSRARETLFGGATRSFLRREDAPVCCWRTERGAVGLS